MLESGSQLTVTRNETTQPLAILGCVNVTDGVTLTVSVPASNLGPQSEPIVNGRLCPGSTLPKAVSYTHLTLPTTSRV